MGLVGYLLALAVWGLIFGALARLALPGKDPMSIPMTIGLGIAGSFMGGLVYALFSDGHRWGGLFPAFLGSALLVYLVRRSRGGGMMSPDADSAERRGSRRY